MDYYYKYMKYKNKYLHAKHTLGYGYERWYSYIC